MNVLVLGSGGREHAIVKKIAESPLCDKLFALPGNDGMKEAELIEGSVMDKDRVLKAVRENDISFVVVTPDDPLADGMVDFLNENGIAAFGPDKKAARIESSKAFAKNLMKKYSIPTADYEIFTNADDALSYVREKGAPIVIKADGLALGKGVTVAMTLDEAEKAIKDAMVSHKFGQSGKKIVIEEYLMGPEISVLAFTDGQTVVPMVSSMDHKRAYDGDEGPNTGGMGAVAPNPYYDEECQKECMEKIFIPTIEAMRAEGSAFKGCLYFGLMKTEDGVKVIEYNSRFGDPETQAVLPLLESDLLAIMISTTDGTLKESKIEWKDASSCVIALASSGYPGQYEKGKRISISHPVSSQIYYAGVKEKNGELLTSGGRVLYVMATAPDLKDAIEKAYEDVKAISFDGAFHRKDIGRKALEEENGKKGLR